MSFVTLWAWQSDKNAKDAIKKATEDTKKQEETPKEVNLKKFAVEELEKMLAKCVEREEYEQAAEIKRVITEKLEERNK